MADIEAKEKEEEELVSLVKKNLWDLENFKEPFIHNSNQYWNEYGGNLWGPCDTEYNKDEYWVNLLYAMVQTMLAAFASDLPNMQFIGLDEKGRKSADLIYPVIMNAFLRDCTQDKILRMIHDASISGAGYLYIHFYDVEKEVNYSEWKNGKKKIKKKKIRQDYGPKTQWIPFSNVFHDGYTLEEADNVYIKRVMNEDEFCYAYKDHKDYDFDLEEVMSNGTIENEDTEEIKAIRYDNVVLVEWYDLVNNTFVLIANDVHINPYEGWLAPNPYPHGQAPLTEFVPFRNPHHQYGHTLAELTEQQRRQYNEYNKMFMQAQRLMMGFMGWDLFDEKLSPKIDETTWVFHVDGYWKEDFWHTAPQINLSYASSQMNVVLRDMTIVTWIDITNVTSVNPYETGTSVNFRKQSFDKRINLSIKQNYMASFKRIAYQFLSMLQSMYNFEDESTKMLIAFENMNVSRLADGTIVKEAKQGENDVVEIRYEDIQWGINVHLDADMLIGANRQSQFEEMMQYITLIGNLRNDDGSAVVKPQTVMRLMDQMFPYWNIEDLWGDDSDIIAQANELFPQGNAQIPQGTSQGGNGAVLIPTQWSRSRFEQTWA